MSLNHYVTLGHSGLRVSQLCLGAMTFGEEWGWGANVADSEAILSRFLERGGNFLDTANGYTLGHSEVIIGNFFAKHGGRDRAVIATKFYTNMFPGDPNGGGASRKSLTAACEESLRRLKTSYIDLYWMHMWDKFTPIDETMRALDDLVRAGKVRYIGFSDTPAWKTTQAQAGAQFRGWTPLVALQIEYSLVERTVEGELMPMAQEMGLGVTPWGPLRGGALSGKYTRENAGQVTAGRGERVTAYLNERTYRMVDELARIGREVKVSPATVAVAWVQSRPGVASTIIGARTRDQLDQNLAAADLVLSADHVAALDAVSEPVLMFPTTVLRSIGNSVMHAGATVNGEPSTLLPNWQQVGSKRY